MPRRLSPEKQFELESLSRVLSVIAAYLDGLSGLGPDAPSLAKAVTRASEERNLRGLRMAQGDLIAMTQAATPAQRRELDHLLRDRVGVSLSSLMDRQEAQISRVRERGKLTSEQQYYLVREHVEFIGDDPERAEELRALSVMLEEYEAAAAKRLERAHRDRAV